MSSPTIQICLKNTFLNFSESPRPTFRRAYTCASIVGSESPYSIPSISTFSSPLALSTSSSGCDQRTKVLDAYVAPVGDCEQTTVMIRGIPKNYDQEMLIAEVQETGLAANFLYLPPGKTKHNRSYGFVNFVTELAAEKFIEIFEGHQWRQARVAKPASVGLATLQGFEQNLAFFSNQEVAKGVAKRSPWIQQ